MSPDISQILGVLLCCVCYVQTYLFVAALQRGLFCVCTYVLPVQDASSAVYWRCVCGGSRHVCYVGTTARCRSSSNVSAVCVHECVCTMQCWLLLATLVYSCTHTYICTYVRTVCTIKDGYSGAPLIQTPELQTPSNMYTRHWNLMIICTLPLCIFNL